MREIGKRIAQAWGALDTVILNAGSCKYVDVRHFDAALVERVVRTNLLASSYCLESALPLLRAGVRPHLVGVVSSVTYWPLPRAEAYGAVVILGIVFIFIVPLPTWLVDILIALNICISCLLIVLALALYYSFYY